jgi:hypothetical protein
MKYRSVFCVITIAFISKFIISGFIEFNNDEVYYWTYAQKLQWSYFDHPPAIALVLKLFTIDLLFDNEIMLRLGPIVCGTISTWLIFLLGKKTGNQHTGIFAALLFMASPYCFLIAGLLVIPDAPQLVFWLWSVLLMVEISEDKKNLGTINTKLLLLGVAIGLCILSKIHGVFLWLGFMVFTVIHQRTLLKNRYLYYSMFITFCLMLPILLWNMSNDFITYRYQGSRVALGAIKWDGFFRELFGEIVYNNPVNFFLILATFWAMIKRKQFIATDSGRLFLSLSIPLILCVLFVALFRDTLPHWTGPAYTSLLPMAAGYIYTMQKDGSKKHIPPVIKWALGVTVTLMILAICIVIWLPLNIGSKDIQELGKHDVTLDMNGWKQFGSQFDSLYRHDLTKGIMHKSTFIISDYWFPAAHIDYYVARRFGIRFLAIGDLTAIHHYAWLNKIRPFLKKGDDAYFITVSNFYNPPKQNLSHQFETVSDMAKITQYRLGVPVRNFFIYRFKNYQGNIPTSGILD